MMTLSKRKKHKEKVIRSLREKILHEIVFVLFIVYAITLIYPFVFVFLNSLNAAPGTPLEFRQSLKQMEDHPFRLPTKFALSSYVEAFKQMDIVNMYYNTITLAVGQTFFSMMLTCMAAYILAKYPFKGSSALYTFIIVCSIVPTFGAEAATFKLMARTKLRNTYLGMILLCGGMGGPFLYVHSFFKGVPWSFAESAKIDGASDFRIFVQIMIPLAKNGIMVFTIMKFMGYWNEYWLPYLYYHNRPTLAVGLYEMQSFAGSTKEGGLAWSVFFAGTILCIIPVLVAYAFLSDKLMGNLTAGGIKG